MRKYAFICVERRTIAWRYIPATKNDNLRVNQVPQRFLYFNQHSVAILGILIHQSSFKRENILSFAVTFESLTPYWMPVEKIHKHYFLLYFYHTVCNSTAFPDDITVNRTITKALVRTTEWFCIQYASIDFQLKTSSAWLYNVSKFRSVHSLRERLLAANKMPQRIQIPLEQNRTFNAQKNGQRGLARR